MKEIQIVNTLRTQEYKYSVSGESVNKFKSFKGEDLAPQQRLERLEKRLNTVLYIALLLSVAIIALLLNR